MIRINKLKIIMLLFVLYVTCSLLLPTFFLNKLVFVLILGLFFLSEGKLRLKIDAPVSIFIIFVYGFCLSLFNRSSMELAVQFLFSILILFLIYPIIYYKIDMDNVIKTGGFILLMADLLYILYAANKYSMNIPFGISRIYSIVDRLVPGAFFEMIERYGETAVGYRGVFGNSSTMIHLGTTPFLYLPTCLWFKDGIKTKKIRYFVLVLMSLFAIFISTSRATLLLTTGMMVVIYINQMKNSNNRMIVFLISLLVVIYILTYILQATEVFSLSEGGNNIKVGHFISAFTEMTPLQFMFGKGLASYYYSSGVGRELAHTEITLLDYCRYFGVPLAFYIYYKLINPFVSRAKTMREVQRDNFDVKALFYGYLLNSLTNPVLMNSLGTLVILWYWAKLYMLTQHDPVKVVVNECGLGQ